MRKVYADSNYWIALLNPGDQWHTAATEASRELGACRIVTSEMVLVEVLNAFAGKGQRVRRAAADLCRRVCDDSNITVEPQTRGLFLNALALYRSHEDKDWSLTDCASIQIMRDQDIKDALSSDMCFAQAGFTPLLRRR